MNVFDIIIFILFAFALWQGFKKGLIVELCGIIGVILGIYVSYKFSHIIFNALGITDKTTKIVSYFLIVIAVLILVYIVAKLISKLLNLTGLGVINNLLGAIASLFKYAIIMSMFLSIFNSLNNNFHWVGRSTIDKSTCYNPLLKFSGTIFPFLRQFNYIFDDTTKLIKDGINNTLNTKTDE